MNLAIWLVLRMMIVFAAMSELLRVALSDTELWVTKHDQSRRVARGDVSA